jgi:hypothetical protein
MHARGCQIAQQAFYGRVRWGFRHGGTGGTDGLGYVAGGVDGGGFPL